ncbi:winged helix DNA-binding protein [Pseudactinotalea sp. HY160]|nr:winged helix DNA-binding protein [Pseudactinotalea sp. HY160]
MEWTVYSDGDSGPTGFAEPSRGGEWGNSMAHHRSMNRVDSTDAAVAARLSHVLRVAAQVWESTLEGTAGSGQVRILRSVAAGATGLVEISSALELDHSTVSVGVRSLIGRGLLESASDPRDRRRRRVRITDAGESLLERAAATEAQALARVLGRVEEAELVAAIEVLDRVVSTLR